MIDGVSPIPRFELTTDGGLHSFMQHCTRGDMHDVISAGRCMNSGAQAILVGQLSISFFSGSHMLS